MPELVQNNGDLLFSARRRVTQLLVALRVTRESADYRPGRTVDALIALESLQRAGTVLNLVGEEQ